MPAQPIEFIHAVHLREREVCVFIDTVTRGEAVSGEAIREAIFFLTKELPLHLMDEEEDLFPLLRRRCTPEDAIGQVIERLQRDHNHAHEDTPAILSLLETLLDGPRDLAAAECSVLATYASNSRRHLILENAIILPFARLRLTKSDVETLRVRMCQRRGIDSLSETPVR